MHVVSFLRIAYKICKQVLQIYVVFFCNLSHLRNFCYFISETRCSEDVSYMYVEFCGFGCKNQLQIKKLRLKGL